MALETVIDEQFDQAAEAVDTGVADDTQAQDGADQGQADPPADDASAAEGEFFSQEEFDQLVAAGDPAAVRKAMQGAYTRKTQSLAAERKELEGGLNLLRAIQSDPGAAVRQMAKELGLSIAEAKEVAQADPTAATAEKLRSVFGEGITQQLFPILQEMLSTHTKSALTPVQEMLEAVKRESVQRESAATLQAFKAKHPDYEKFQPIMMQLAGNYTPKDGVWTLERLDDLYELATARANRAKDARATSDRMIDSARAAATSAGPRATPKGNFSATPPPAADLNSAMDRAFEAAKRGQRYKY